MHAAEGQVAVDPTDRGGGHVSDTGNAAREGAAPSSPLGASRGQTTARMGGDQQVVAPDLRGGGAGFFWHVVGVYY